VRSTVERAYQTIRRESVASDEVGFSASLERLGSHPGGGLHRGKRQSVALGIISHITSTE